jgi:23S rRNA (adenine2503-C2)-methyltransferase
MTTRPPAHLIHGLTMDEMVASCREAGFAAFRAKQIWNWLYIKQVNTWDQMRNVSAEVRAWLAATYSLQPVKPVEVQGEESGTRKILVALGDGEHIEEVIIPTRDHETVCVSSQVGCKIACTFCASGSGGYVRNLGAGEIVGQVLLAQQELGRRPANLVYMGMGEPLDNYDAVLKSIRILNHPDGVAIGARHITVSTSGLIPAIRRLSGEGLQIELSVSLHAPDDALRTRLMPINRAYPLADLISTCADYAVATGRIVTFVYTLIRGLNDTREQAEALARLIKPVQCRVNLIPLSPVEGFAGEPPAPGTANLFMDILDRAGINATVRASKGTRIEAACGQLRLRRQQARKVPL